VSKIIALGFNFGFLPLLLAKKAKKTEKNPLQLQLNNFTLHSALKLLCATFKAISTATKATASSASSDLIVFSFLFYYFFFFHWQPLVLPPMHFLAFFSSWQWTLEQVGFGAIAAKGVIRIYMSIFRGMSQKSRMSRIKWNTNRT